MVDAGLAKSEKNHRLLGNVALGYGMQKIGDISSYSPLELVLSGVASPMDPWVLLGVFLLLVFFGGLYR